MVKGRESVIVRQNPTLGLRMSVKDLWAPSATEGEMYKKSNRPFSREFQVNAKSLGK